MQPTERTLIFNLNPANDAEVRSNGLFLDIAQVHNIVNRVFARQGRNYVVDSIEIGVQPGGSFTAAVYRLPQHWPVYNAWEKTFRHWQDQREESAREAGLESTRARYSDFKVFMDQAHAASGTSANLVPVGYATSFAVSASESYEWNASQVVLPNAGGSAAPTEVYLHMVGDDTGATPLLSTSCGMIKAYAESRSRPFATDPNIVNVPADHTLYGAMEDVAEIMDDVITNYQEHNHVPPYVIDNDTNDEFYPGGVNQGSTNAPSTWGEGLTLVDCLSTNANQNYNTDSLGPFVAPCGLLKISFEAANVDVTNPLNVGEFGLGLWMKVKLAPGEYKGLMSQSMQEAN